MTEVFENISIFRPDDNVYMVVHHDIGREFVSFPIEVAEGIHHNIPLAGLQVILVLVLPPRDKVGRTPQPPVRQVAAIDDQLISGGLMSLTRDS